MNVFTGAIEISYLEDVLRSLTSTLAMMMRSSFWGSFVFDSLHTMDDVNSNIMWLMRQRGMYREIDTDDI